ncbi:TPA: alanine/ornithine racemase family PLP-dependent enzyme [Photobacterium damselae]|uniref:alanine/ornithine racemase family PLP-dependent enzyme n=1 Tax=Photobacterium damselae TaxID=38293 RepID=UPI000D65FC20|nr:alanine/ornithine racemase family PLP-dependent enzyme [Photobacterium damselae]AWK81794.1 alanine racemase [Photobacterium damselae]MCG3811074.1 alanine/ornithine racemase family PLP-dependent enzyme [Photobacterium damselae]MCG3823932.1 alanine/ornithine racemase family PLP-dependent enzyme [Photobacterium damselae]
MLAYPQIVIDLDKISDNAHAMLSLCHQHHIEPVAVTKLVCSQPEVVKTIVESGITVIADSRIANLQNIQELPARKLLLRLPSMSEVPDVINYADISLNSEPEILIALSKEAEIRNKRHKVIIMHDLGDLREGCIDEEQTLSLANLAHQLPGIELIGIGSNLACYGGVEPSYENQNHLIAIAERIEHQLDMKLTVISGASSAGLILLFKNEMPEQINQLRLGASILMGIGLNDEAIPNTHQDAFTLNCEIIELKEKPSVPEHSTALDAFGLKPEFIDRGIRKRAICAIGKQDVDYHLITPVDSGVLKVGSSSDHLIIDLTDSKLEYHVGDIVTFSLEYGGVLQCMTSKYVNKKYITNNALNNEVFHV